MAFPLRSLVLKVSRIISSALRVFLILYIYLLTYLQLQHGRRPRQQERRALHSAQRATYVAEAKRAAIVPPSRRVRPRAPSADIRPGSSIMSLNPYKIARPASALACILGPAGILSNDHSFQRPGIVMSGLLEMPDTYRHPQPHQVPR